MKRKADSIDDSPSSSQSSNKKRSIAPEPSSKSPKISKKPEPKGVKSNFRKGLFDKEVLDDYTAQYASSSPYKHTVIHDLIDDTLLRNVRNEIQENVHFTPKETDIYKIHQSGDLANLDGLDNAALAKLPSLLKLRDSLYSKEFRDYVGTVTGVGKAGLSGKKTDMAVNVYVPGCYLLCHDDVIGSRRVSYILYLVDPDIPWKAEWGGALRLFPTAEGEEGKEKSYTPKPDTTKSIPPAWNQLSFFAVQPGESFHDVEEVYYAETKEALEKDGGRIRMAISGWFHVPQEGEEGYIEGLEASLATKSSLVQLQGKDDKYDFPQEQKAIVDRSSQQDLDEKDFEFLLKYLAPVYLTPDTMESVHEHFGAASSITLDGILSKKFAARIKYEIEKQDAKALPSDTESIEKDSNGWKVAKPPHKHRFLYKHPLSDDKQESVKGKGKSKSKGKDSETPALDELLNVFLPSRQFRQWLELATECEIEDYDVVARRFRRGKDYALATSHEGKPRLEFSLGLTPSSGWIVDDEGEDEDEKEEDEEGEDKQTSTKPTSSNTSKPKPAPQEGKGKEKQEPPKDKASSIIKELGGHEIYMATDDSSGPTDAAIYKSSSSTENPEGEEEDPILFSITPAWNTLSLVLRDGGPLRFVKFVSAGAEGDRWDVQGILGVKEEEDEEDEEGEGKGEKDGDGEEDGENEEGEGEGEEKKDSQETTITLEEMGEDDDEDTFHGFPDSGDSESD